MSSEELQQLKRKAQALLDVGRAEEAVKLLSRALSLSPNDDDALCLMTLAFVELANWKEARRYVTRAVAAAPENDWAHRLNSIVLKNCACNLEAVDAAREAVRLAPWLPHNLHTLASAQLHIFNLPEARQAADQLLELAPEWHMSHQMMALVALKEGKNKEAEMHCRRELELEPNSFYGMNNLGVALLNQKKRREAIEAFNNAAKIDPTSTLAQNNISAAASKYLPRVAIPGVVIYLLFNALRGMGGRGDIAGIIIVIAIIALLFGGIYWYTTHRYNKLPSEVRTYLESTNVKASPSLRWRSHLWSRGLVVCIGLFVAWSFYVLIKWNGDHEAVDIADLIVTLILAATLAGFIVGYKRSR
jgi:tetratricopeptide (TPR) repeat protein